MELESWKYLLIVSKAAPLIFDNTLLVLLFTNTLFCNKNSDF